MTITRSLFWHNTGYYGGAVSIYSLSPLYIDILHSRFEKNLAYIAGGAVYAYVKTAINISETRFIDNICEAPGLGTLLGTGHGGAIALDGIKEATYKTTINKCHFEGNNAMAMGGTLYSALRSADIQLLNVVFESSKEKEKRAIDGDIVFCLSKLHMQNTTVRIKKPINERNVFYVHNDVIVIDGNSSFHCTKGFLTVVMSIKSSPLIDGKFSLFSMLCRTCEYDHYSVAESSFENLKINNPPWFPCPPDGVCRRGISIPKDNFWGYQVNASSRITYIQLPIGYGCTGAECKTYDSCAANRESVMCGKCKKGHSEHILMQGCISNNYCNSKEFWLLAIGVAMSYIALFLYKAEIFSFFKGQLSRMCSRNGGTTESEKEDSVAEDVYVGLKNDMSHENVTNAEPVSVNFRNSDGSGNLGSGLLKIAFYFYQIEIILHEDISNKDNILMKQLQQLTRSFFNFNFLATYDSNLCAFSSTTPVIKVLVRIGLISMVFMGLGIIIIITKLLEKIPIERFASFCGRLSERALSASFEIFVLVYGVNMMSAWKLLNCVALNNEKRLLIQGDIHCYQPWQYIIMSVCILWALPYCIFIFILPKMLLQKETGRSGIFLGCLFPLPFLIRAVYKRVLLTPFAALENVSNDPVLQRILHSLIAPFMKSKRSREYLWWEGVYIFRRLFLICIVRFVHDPIARIQLMVHVQVLFLLHHVHCKPFKRRFLNHLETASLTILVTFSSISALNVYDYSYGITQQDSSIILVIFSWLRLSIMIAIPCIAAVVFVVPFVSWFARLVIKLVFSLKLCCRTDSA